MDFREGCDADCRGHFLSAEYQTRMMDHAILRSCEDFLEIVRIG